MPSMKQKTDTILNDKRNSNEILEVLLKLKGDDERAKTKPIQSLCMIFKTYLNDKSMYLKKKFVAEDNNNDNNSIYRNWLTLRFREAFQGICELMLSGDSVISELSVKSMRKLLIAESLHPIRPSENIGEAFPLATYRILMDVLMSPSVNATTIIDQISEMFLFDDVRYYTMKIIHSKVKQYQDKCELPQLMLTNTLAILHQLTIVGSDEDCDFNTMVKCKEDASNKILQPSNQKKVFTELWMDFLKLKISTSFYKTVLVSLHEKVMPYFTCPLVLSDFLTTSYDIGGSISILALNAIFILINKYNLNYPDFYQKLYKLLDPTVLHAKYKSRFFYLCDLFLTSTHLPCYLVAAFIKRLSTLALMADPSTAILLLPFIFNLIKRHPNTAILLDRTEPHSVETDPYLVNEVDPSKCNAMQSSLWEIKTLQSHYYYPVQQEAMKINSKLSNDEIDICTLLDDDYDTLFKTETEKGYKQAPMTYKMSDNLFDIDSDYLTVE